jgi:hypothetical protein
MDVGQKLTKDQQQTILGGNRVCPCTSRYTAVGSNECTFPPVGTDFGTCYGTIVDGQCCV